MSGGIITGVVDTGCQHLTGLDQDHGATTVQLMPYLDTPNNGGDYKVMVTEVSDYLVDCGYTGGNFHGFVPADSKSDNFKVGDQRPLEIDTRFFDDANGDGAKGEAHVDAVEAGTHRITIADQPGCAVGDVWLDGVRLGQSGPQTVSVAISRSKRELTVFIDVACT